MHIESDYRNFSNMSSTLVEQISKLLSSSMYTDKDIAKMTGVTRGMVYRWRTGKVKTIRRTNVYTLCDALGYDAVMEGEDLTLKPQLAKEKSRVEVTHLSTKTSEKVIDALLLDKEKLYEQISHLQKDIDNEKSQASYWKTKFEECMCNQDNLPQLDHSRHQAIINLKTGRFHSISTAFALFLSYTPLEVLSNDFSWATITFEEDRWIANIIKNHIEKVGYSEETIKEASNMILSTWRLKSKINKAKYVHAELLYLTGDFGFVEIKGASKKEWDIVLEKMTNKEKICN